MAKKNYIIKCGNEAFTGVRNRGSMSVEFHDGVAETDKKNVAEYWHEQPGYTCENLDGTPVENSKVKVKLLKDHGIHKAGAELEFKKETADKMVEEKIAEIVE